jgi:hypothetical protein
MYQDAGSGAAAPKKKGGCLKWGGIGCAVLLIIVIIAVGIVYSKRGAIMEWFGDKMSAVLVEALPEDFPEAEALDTIDAFWTAIKEDKLQPSDMQELQAKIRAAESDGDFSGEEAIELIRFMQEKVGMDTKEDPYAGTDQQYEEEGWEEDEPAGTTEEEAGDGTEL